MIFHESLRLPPRDGSPSADMNQLPERLAQEHLGVDLRI